LSEQNRLLLIGGDGVGAEVVHEAGRIAQWFAARRGLPLSIGQAAFGVEVLNRTGRIMTDDTLAQIRAADAVLFGAIGGPEYDRLPLEQVREEGLLRIRRELGLYANLRPVRYWPALAELCPFVPERVEKVDMMIVRELAGGIYYASPRGIDQTGDGRRVGTNTQRYDDLEIRRIARVAFELARARGGRVCSVDKSNVLESGLLWREEVQACRDAEYPDVELEHILVDNCALQLCLRPARFDVLLADNLFGDILSDAAGAVAGSLGMLPSASFGAEDGGRRRGFYEPVHGSAPDIAGQGIANPLGAILSLALALRWTFRQPAEADLLERAVERALAGGARTLDLLAGAAAPALSTRAMADAVLQALETLAA